MRKNGVKPSPSPSADTPDAKPVEVATIAPEKNLSEKVRIQPLGQSRIANQSVTADLTREYVAGGTAGWVWSANFISSLPFYIDDISRDFGDDIYERMLLDSQVSSDIETLKLSCLANGVVLQSACPKDTDPDYATAGQIRDFCQKVIDGLETPLGMVLFEMLDAIAYGNRVAELVYDIPTIGPLSGKLIPRYIKTKPRRSVAFVVDPMNNVRGLLGNIPGMYSPMLVGTMLIDTTAPNLLPRHKFAVLTNQGQNGDPRGRSLLRPAYNPWWLKQMNYPDYLKYLAMFAVPGLIGTTAEGVSDEQVLDEYGDPILNQDGIPRVVSAQQAMLESLLRYRNATAAAFPFGASVTPLEVADGVSPYESFIDARNREISVAITGQTLSSMEGNHQSRAAAETHGDKTDLRVNMMKTAVENMLRQDILRQVVEKNFGPEMAALFTPFASLSDTEPQDFNINAGAISDLWAKKYLSPSQLSAMDAKLGLPTRTDEEMKVLTDAALMPPMDPNAQQGAEGDGDGDEGDSGAKFAADLIWSAMGPASQYVFFDDDAKPKGHFITIGGHVVFIPDGGGDKVEKGDKNVKEAIAKHLPGSDQNAAYQIGKGITAGTIKNVGDLHHTIAIAHAAHAVSKDVGKAKEDSNVGNGSVKAAVEAGANIAQIHANAASHPDPKVKAKAALLSEKLKGVMSDTDPRIKDAGGATAGDAEKGADAVKLPAGWNAIVNPATKSTYYTLENGDDDATVLKVLAGEHEGKWRAVAYDAGGNSIIQSHYDTPQEALDAAHKAIQDDKAKSAAPVGNTPDAKGVNVPDTWESKVGSTGNTSFWLKDGNGYVAKLSGANKANAGKWKANVEDEDMNTIFKDYYDTPQEAIDAADKAVAEHKADTADKAPADSVDATPAKTGTATPDGYTKVHSGHYTITEGDKSGMVTKLPDGKFHATAGTTGERPSHNEIHDTLEAATEAVSKEVGHVPTPATAAADPADSAGSTTPADTTAASDTSSVKPPHGWEDKSENGEQDFEVKHPDTNSSGSVWKENSTGKWHSIATDATGKTIGPKATHDSAQEAFQEVTDHIDNHAAGEGETNLGDAILNSPNSNHAPADAGKTTGTGGGTPSTPDPADTPTVPATAPKVASPAMASSPSLVFDSKKSTSEVNGGTTDLNGVPLHTVGHEGEFWKKHTQVAGAGGDWPDIPGKTKSSGVILVEPDGKVWIHKVKGDHGGYKYTFAKGGVESDLTPQQNALKETFEEQGLKGSIDSHLGDFEGDTTNTRYYVGKRVGGNPNDFGNETDSVHLVTPEEAEKLLNKPRDKAVLKALNEHLAKNGIPGGNPGLADNAPDPAAITTKPKTTVLSAVTPAASNIPANFKEGALGEYQGTHPDTGAIAQVYDTAGKKGTYLYTKDGAEIEGEKLHDSAKEALDYASKALNDHAAGVTAPGAATPSAPGVDTVDHVTYKGAKTPLSDESIADTHIEDAKGGVSEAAKKYLDQAKNSGAIKTVGDMHQFLAIAEASSKAKGKNYVSGDGMKTAIAHPTIAKLKDAAEGGNVEAHSAVEQLGDTSIESDGDKSKKATAAANIAATKAKGELGADHYKFKKTSNALGGNSGGFFDAADGKSHYVKNYDNPEQAHSEHAANALYKALGFTAPDSTTFHDSGSKGGVGYASENISHLGHVGKAPDAETSKEILKGFAADVLLANHDVLGLSGDNTVKAKGGGVIRLDNGGAGAFKATGGAKHQGHLDRIGQFDDFADSSENANYANVFKAAGVDKAENIAGITNQISAIEDLKAEHGGTFVNFLKKVAPNMQEAQQKSFGKILDHRADLLSAKKQEIHKVKADEGEAIKKTYPVPLDDHSEVAKANTMFATQATKATDADSAAASWWKSNDNYTDGWSVTNAALFAHGHPDKISPAQKKRVEKLDKVFAKPHSKTTEKLVLLRKFGVPHDAKLQKKMLNAQPGEVFHVPGYQAASVGTSGSSYSKTTGFVWHIHVPEGTPLVHIDGTISKAAGSMSLGEKELLLNHGNSYKILSTHVDKSTGYTHHHVEVVPG